MICKAKRLIIDEKEVHIRPVRGARGLRLRLTPKGEIHVSAPYFCLERQIIAFVHTHKDWLEAQLASHAPRYFQDGMTLTIAGESLTIHHVPDARRGVWREGESLCVSGEAAFLHRRVRSYVKKATHHCLMQEVERLAPRLQRQPPRLSLKDTRSRWGSCSSTGHLNFCWKIGLTPRYVIEYLVAHELAHLEQMNHSPAFWAVVARLTDQRASAEIWLRRHGRDVLQFE